MFGLLQFLRSALMLCRFLLLLYALSTYFPKLSQSSLGQALYYLVDPVLAPFRRFNLQVGMMDFTVVVALLSIELLETVVFSWLV